MASSRATCSNQGVARRVDVQPGRVVMAVSGLVLWCSIPLRQRPRLTTISNAVLIGLSTNLGLDRLPALRGCALRIARSCVALVLSALARAGRPCAHASVHGPETP